MWIYRDWGYAGQVFPSAGSDLDLLYLSSCNDVLLLEME